MPRPMMPTQLTVFTSASTSALRMSPVAYLIIAHLSVVPVGANFDWRPMRRTVHRRHHLLGDRSRLDTDPPNEPPRDRPLDQEFGLLALFHLSRDTNT